MKTPQELVEHYLEQCLMDGIFSYEKRSDALWTIPEAAPGLNNIIIHADETYTIFEIKILNQSSLTAPQKASLHETLLTLNMSQMFSGGYALSGDDVMLVNTMPAENMQLAEFVGIIEAMTTSFIEDYPKIKELVQGMKKR